MKSKESQRATLLARLAAAAGLLVGHGHKDSCSAVREASDLINALPKDNEHPAPLLLGNLDELRAIRQWHYDQFNDYNKRAADARKKSDSRMFTSDSRDAYERTANGFQSRANQHLRFVRSMNALFPARDGVI